MTLEESVNSLPDKPGVYMFRDARDRVIYVGKAASLRNRVRSYARGGRGRDRRTELMLSRISRVEYIVTDSPVEALILECNLIKKHRPAFNIRLRDDKNYPYIRVSVGHDYPRVSVVRNMHRDGARYFGPYTRAGAMHQTLRAVRRIFPFRTCSDRKFDSASRPCLDYHIKRCAGPCCGLVSRESYGSMIQNLCLFLEGRGKGVLEFLKAQMEEAALGLEFEKAAEIRDRIRAAEDVMSKQKMASANFGDLDAIGYAGEGGEAVVQLFAVRDGLVVGRENFLLAGTEGRSPGEAISAFVKAYYARASFIPPEIVLPEEIEDREAAESWLRSLRGAKVNLRCPRRGDKKELLEMATANARLALKELVGSGPADAGALESLRSVLGLKELPERIECFDVSNISGRHAVASMVVFRNGAPDRSGYRRFKLSSGGEPDDYAMMTEAVARRYRHLVGDDAEGDDSFRQLPDLVVVDGGKGQLGAALEALRSLGLANIPVVALAKSREHIYLPGAAEPVSLPRGSPALLLVQRLRDEAHRFALGYHRSVRGKSNTSSVLEEVPGIGPARRRELLRRFGSVEALRRAGIEEISGVPGMNSSLARRLKEHLG